MNEKIADYLSLADLFESHGFHLYMVGGTVRDYLLDIDLDDMDLVSDATPEMMKMILKDFKVDDTFSRMGSIKLKYNSNKFDITTLRKEKRYKDARHPLDVKFVKKLKIDVKRRDFSINAMYMDKNLKLIDMVNGRNDLNKRKLVMIGNPTKRLKEDPLRIIRAIRFSITYNLTMDSKLIKAIKKTSVYLNKINQSKIIQDLKKIPNLDKEILIKIFKELSISYPIEMLNL